MHQLHILRFRAEEKMIEKIPLTWFKKNLAACDYFNVLFKHFRHEIGRKSRQYACLNTPLMGNKIFEILSNLRAWNANISSREGLFHVVWATLNEFEHKKGEKMNQEPAKSISWLLSEYFWKWPILQKPGLKKNR